jgi:hypothetical protein
MVCDMTDGHIKCSLHVVMHSLTFCGMPKDTLGILWYVMNFGKLRFLKHVVIWSLICLSLYIVLAGIT